MTDLTQGELATLTRRYLELAQQAETIEIEQRQIKDKIRANVAVGSVTTGDGVKVTVSPNRRFSPELAAAVIPDSFLPVCRETRISPAKAKAALPPAVYEQCMAEAGDPKVTIA